MFESGFFRHTERQRIAGNSGANQPSMEDDISIEMDLWAIVAHPPSVGGGHMRTNRGAFLNFLFVWGLCGLTHTAFPPGIQSAVTTFDVLVATGSMISKTTITIEGTELSVGATSFVVAGGTVSFGGLLRRRTSDAIGSNASTHINLGHQSTTGEAAQNYSYATVGGGVSNQAFGESSIVGGGNGNQAAKQYATVGGGNANQAFGEYSWLGGGSGNTAHGDYSVASGGQLNKSRGYASTVPGGYSNVAAGDYSFAAGQSAKVTAKGGYVWADSSTSSQLINSATNQYYIRAQGGFYVETTSVTFTGELNMATDQGISLTGPGGTLVSASSVTASSFFGDGANLTGVIASGSVAKTGDTMTGQLTLAGATLTVQGNAFSVGGSSFVVNASSVGIRTATPAAALDVAGSVQVGTGTAKSTFTAAGLLKLNGFGLEWADGSVTTSAAIPPNFARLNTTQTWSANQNFSGVTTSGDLQVGGQSILVGTVSIRGNALGVAGSITATSSATILGQGIFGGTLTVQGNALGVAGSVSATSATLSATGAQTYALTTSSGIHMVNGKIQLDSGAMIMWPDGTTSVTSGDAVLKGSQTFSGSNTFTGSNSFTATTTIGGTSGGLTIADGTTCTGIACRVGYSNGTSGKFSFVLYATTTYRLDFSVTITSGSSGAANSFKCFINDVTAGDYGQIQDSYPGGYVMNSLTYTNWVLNNCGGGTVSSTDYTNGSLTLRSPEGLSNRLTAYGTWIASCQTQANLQNQRSVMVFNGAGPWTLSCSPIPGFGWNHEAILYQVGK